MNEDTAGRRCRLIRVLVVVAALAIGSAACSGVPEARPAQFELLDLATGATLWSLEVDTQRRPVVAGDLVVLAEDDRVWAVNDSGEVAWEATIGRSLSIKAVAGETVYAAAIPEDGVTVVALDAATGAERWRRLGFFEQASDTRVVTRQDGDYTVRHAASGDVLASFSMGRRGDVNVGPAGVVYFKNSGTLRLIDDAGGKRIIAKRLPERTKVALVTADTVVVHHGSGINKRTLFGYDLATAERLWRRVTENDIAMEETTSGAVARIHGISYDLGVRTGELTPNGGWTATDPNAPQVAAVGEPSFSVGPVRYLTRLGGVVAVDRESGGVLWRDPAAIPVGSTEGIAMFRNDHGYWMVDATTGTTIAEVARRSSTSGVVGDGAGLVVAGGEVIFIDRARGQRKLGEFKKQARAGAVNRDYAAVTQSVAGETGGLVLRAVVFAVSDGSRVFDRTFDSTGTISLGGDHIVFEGGRDVIAIDLKSGDEDRSVEFGHRDERLFGTDLLVAFTPEGDRLLWEHEVDDHTTVMPAGDNVLIFTIPPGFD